jgi:hypothetical protein
MESTIYLGCSYWHSQIFFKYFNIQEDSSFSFTKNVFIEEKEKKIEILSIGK